MGLPALLQKQIMRRILSYHNFIFDGPSRTILSHAGLVRRNLLFSHDADNVVALLKVRDPIIEDALRLVVEVLPLWLHILGLR